ncbi:hypothetical protein EVA_08472 [gut metagenome]|uniref:HTH OST-type domain-containing protein n=1 Tax=gut metagenome TaxID=749906 RepID=J9G837_9ZZZZ
MSGKNATDMALVIDTIELLHSGIYDAFVIVSSDSDYTPLAIKLHESGVYVMGFGEKKTPESFRNSCDKFVFLENLSDESEKTQLQNKEDQPQEVPITEDLPVVHELLKKAWETYQNEDGYADICAAGSFIKRAKSDFDSRTYGYKKLPDLVAAYPERYDVRERKGKGTTMLMVYKCLDSVQLQKGRVPIKANQKPAQCEYARTVSLEQLHTLLEIAWENHQDSQGQVLLSVAGSYLQTVVPGIQWKTYGYKKLVDLVRACPERYEVGTNKNGGWCYQCLRYVKAPELMAMSAQQMTEGHKKAQEKDLETIHAMIHEVWQQQKDAQNYVKISVVGNYLHKNCFRADWKSFGYKQLSALLNDFPKKYQLNKGKDSVRCCK